MLRLSMTIPWVENSAGVNTEEGAPSDDTSLSASYTINQTFIVLLKYLSLLYFLSSSSLTNNWLCFVQASSVRVKGLHNFVKNSEKKKYNFEDFVNFCDCL